jgi:hypothetical protein
MAKLGLAIKQYKKILTVNPRCSHVLYHIADCYCHLAYLTLNSAANASLANGNGNGAQSNGASTLTSLAPSSALKNSNAAPFLTANMSSQKLAYQQRDHKEPQNRLLHTMMTSGHPANLAGVDSNTHNAPSSTSTSINSNAHANSPQSLTAKYKGLAEEFYRVACDADPRGTIRCAFFFFFFFFGFCLFFCFFFENKILIITYFVWIKNLSNLH